MRLDYTDQELRDMALQIRKNIIECLHCAGSGHPGGSLSAAEILSVLYFKEMDVEPQDPAWARRDRFVLSKGHAAPVYYSALAERGYLPRQELETLRQLNSRLQGHPDRKRLPGVDMSTGSLGQGISAAAGMALYAKKQENAFRVYCLIGDGEMQEGQLWEAMMAASHYGLGNFTVLLDNNNLQIDGSVDQIMSIYPVADKAAAFGWQVLHADGHDVASISAALDEARKDTKRPAFIICSTIKGKGVSFMEDQASWHGSPVSDEQYEAAMAQLKG